MNLKQWEEISKHLEEYSELSVVGDHRDCFSLCTPTNPKHRVFLSFFSNGQVHSRRYMDGLVTHRPISEGPAFESFGMDGSIFTRAFCVNGHYVATDKNYPKSYSRKDDK
jgi:hypothetical protein